MFLPAHLCALLLKNKTCLKKLLCLVTSSTLSSSTNPSPIETTPSTVLISDHQKVLIKFTLTCIHLLCNQNRNQNIHHETNTTSGIILQYLIIVLDAKNWCATNSVRNTNTNMSNTPSLSTSIPTTTTAVDSYTVPDLIMKDAFKLFGLTLRGFVHEIKKFKRRPLSSPTTDGNLDENAKGGGNIKSLHLSVQTLLYLSILNSERHLDLFIVHILACPLLFDVVDTPEFVKRLMVVTDTCLERILTNPTTHCLRLQDYDTLLFFIGNMTLLVKKLLHDDMRLSADTSFMKTFTSRFIKVVTMLLDICFHSIHQQTVHKTSAVARFHPLLGWVSAGDMTVKKEEDLIVPNEFYKVLLSHLSFLWNPIFIQMAFDEVLSLEMDEMHEARGVLSPSLSRLSLKHSSAKNASSSISSINNGENNNKSHTQQCSSSDMILKSLSIVSTCNMYLNLLYTLTSSKSHILNNLAWTHQLLPKLWYLMNQLSPPHFHNGHHLKNVLIPFFSSSESTASTFPTMNIFLASAKNPTLEIYTPLLNLFCESCCILFLTLDQEDIYLKQHPFKLTQLSDICKFLNLYCFRSIWDATTSSTSSLSSPSTSSSAITQQQQLPQRPQSYTHVSSRKFLNMLYHYSSYRLFGDETWLIPETGKKAFIDDILEKGEVRCMKLLTHLPHCIPFKTRVHIFRSLIARDKKMLTGCENGNGRELSIVVHRKRVCFYLDTEYGWLLTSTRF